MITPAICRLKSDVSVAVFHNENMPRENASATESHGKHESSSKGIFNFFVYFRVFPWLNLS